MCLCAPGDVGSGHVLPSRKINQDEIEAIKILMVSLRFKLFALHQTELFLVPKVKFLSSLASFFAELHTALYISQIAVVLQTVRLNVSVKG